nr:RES family NAD+ phosphorylase [Vibrio sinus]
MTQKKFAKSPFDPIGAATFGGRWNSKGVEALYFAESESLCCLEVFVHVDNDPGLIYQYDLYRVDVPNELIASLDESDLPHDWKSIPASQSTKAIGDQFLTAKGLKFIALRVPSSISPRDSNYVVNPNHPKSEAIFNKAVKFDFEFDSRIFK